MTAPTTTQSTESADLQAILATLNTLTAEVQSLRSEVADIRRTKAKGAELWDEIGPIGKEVMAGAMDTFLELDNKGYFTFAKELLGVADHVVTGFTAQDVRDLADNVVDILDTVRTITQPGMLAFAQQAGEAVEHSDRNGPVGAWEMLKASNDEDVKYGTAVMLSIVRQIGRTARGNKPKGRATPKHPKYARMAGRLAGTRPRRSGRRLAGPDAPSVNAPKPSAAVATKTAATTVPLPAPFDGLETDPNGHLLNNDDWSHEYAHAAAASVGVGPLTEEHFKVLDFARGAYIDKGKSPNVRALANGSGLGTKGIYGLFPKKPGPTIAFIAGIPKPVGCI